MSMLSFCHFFLLSVIAISLGEEVPLQALASKETQLEPTAQAVLPEVPDTAHAATKPTTELAASQTKVAEKPETESAVAVGVQASDGIGDTHVQDATKDAPALEAPRDPPASVEMASTLKEEEPAPEGMAPGNLLKEMEKDELAPEGMAPAPEPEGSALKEDEVLEVTHVWHLAALLSFVGVAFYSLVFLCKVFTLPTKGQSQGSSGGKSPSSSHEELDFEDLEGDFNAALATLTTPKRKSAARTLEEPQTLPKEDAQDDGDDAWGDNNAWGNDSWDDLDDCEADLKTIDLAVPSVNLPPAPPPVKKRGKAD